MGGKDLRSEASKHSDNQRLALKLAELRERVEIMKKQSRFPLTDIQREGEAYMDQVRMKYGAVRTMEKELASRIGRFKHRSNEYSQI